VPCADCIIAHVARECEDQVGDGGLAMAKAWGSGVDAEKRLLLHAVRGSASTVMLAMILLPALHGEGRLASACGLNRSTVHRCLYDLEALGFVYRGGRYEAWILVPGVRQMVLGEGENLSIEGEILTLPSSSSSRVHDDSGECSERDRETTTTSGGEGENLSIPEGMEGAYGVLVGMGCSPKAAVGGLVAAGLRGDGAGEVGERVDGWAVYCGSDRGASIRAPGFLSARRVGEGVDAPVGRQETRDEKAARYVTEVMERRADEGG